MLISDSDAFALVIPTYEGAPFLARTLDHFRQLQYPGLIVLADDSQGAHREFVLGAPAAYPELWLDVHEYPHGTRFLPKLCATFERLTARCVMLCAQDDFVVPEARERLVAALEQDAALSAARGRVARFSLRRSKESASTQVELHRHPMREYLEEDPAPRVLEHVRDYAATLYSVHRRELFLQALATTEARTRNVIFFQYLSSCLTACQGRIACLDDLYYIRQGHAQSWAARLKGDYEHWPLLIASPRYSGYVTEFREAVTDALGSAADGTFGAAFDEAYVDMVRRSLCSVGRPNPRDEAFFARLSDRSSSEGRQLAECVGFCLRYPDTY